MPQSQSFTMTTARRHLVGRPDIEETVARLAAHAQAGADCLYAPGLRSREDVTAAVAAVHSKPLNLLIGSAGDLDAFFKNR